MEGLNSFYAYLKNLRHQAGILAEAVVSLNKSFEAEADRLTREDGVRRLKALHTDVLEESERLKRLENTASRGYDKADYTLSFFGSMTKFIAAATIKDRRVRNVVDYVCDRDAYEKLTYGTVMVCIGAQGLPDDVRVVSISELARKSKCLESEAIRNLQQADCLLFSQETFSSFIDKLVADIREGQLCLPVPSEKVSEIGKSYYLAIESKQSKWVAISRPQKPTSIFRSK